MTPTTTTYACDYRENTFWGSVELTLYPDGQLKKCQLTACWVPDWESHQASRPLAGYHRTVMTLAYRSLRQDFVFSTEVIPYNDAPTASKHPPVRDVTADRLAVRTVVNVLRYLKKGGQYPFASRAERGRFVHFLMNPRRRP